jgi:hypothetical protein
VRKVHNCMVNEDKGAGFALKAHGVAKVPLNRLFWYEFDPRCWGVLTAEFAVHSLLVTAGYRPEAPIVFSAVFESPPESEH